MAFSNNAVIPFNSAPKVPPQYNNYRGNGGFESNGGDYEEEYQSDYEEYADHHMVVLNNDGGSVKYRTFSEFMYLNNTLMYGKWVDESKCVILFDLAEDMGH